MSWDDIKNYVRVRIWLRIRKAFFAVHLLPAFASLTLAYLLAEGGQSRQIYLALFQDLAAIEIACAIAALTLLTAAIFLLHRLLGSSPNFSPANLAGWSDIGEFDWLNRHTGLFWALLPWVALAYGSISAGLQLGAYEAMANELSGFSVISKDAEHTWAAASGSLLAAVVGFAVVLFLYFHGDSRNLFRSVSTICVVLFLVAALGPSFWAEGAAVSLQRIGPLATLILAFLFLFLLLATLSQLSRQTGFPILSLTVLSLIIWELFGDRLAFLIYVPALLFVLAAILALFSDNISFFLLSLFVAVFIGLAVFRVDQTLDAKIHTTKNSIITDQFGEPENAPIADAWGRWFEARGDKGSWKGRPYPVFVVAAQGGGIYAALSSAMVLSRLQEQNAFFSEHVFAIVGVSGGGVGASVFQSMMQGQPMLPDGQTGDQNCPRLLTAVATSKNYTDLALAILLRDHLSPMLRAMLPDIIGFTHDARGNALAGSLTGTGQRKSRSQELRQIYGNLRKSYRNHWRSRCAAPAVLIQATDVQTGKRLAFSPFSLKGVGYDGLVSSGDAKLVDGAGQHVNSSLSLAAAALVSARFPAIMPAYTAFSSDGLKIQNFVDGGYADNSGVSTALEIVEKLQQLGNSKIHVRLIAITSADTKQQFDQGTKLTDSVAPVLALLNVRRHLAAQAVSRACAELGGLGGDSTTSVALRSDKDTVCDVAQRQSDWRIKLIKLNADALSFPLAWRFSRDSAEILKLELGTDKGAEKRCDEKPHSSKYQTEIENACAMRDVMEVLTPK